MSKWKHVLILSVIALVLAAMGGYAWLDYQRAQTALWRAQLHLRSVDNALHKDRNIDKAESEYRLARIEVETVDNSHSTWIGGDVREALRKELSAYKKEIEDGKGSQSP